MKTSVPLLPLGKFMAEDLYAKKRLQFWSGSRKEYQANITFRQRWHVDYLIYVREV